MTFIEVTEVREGKVYHIAASRIIALNAVAGVGTGLTLEGSAPITVSQSLDSLLAQLAAA